MIPLISVVIPSLNKVRFIGQTLDSVLAQDYPNFEIIVMDGGSGDGTLEIIRKYARKYPKIIHYESKKDKGQWDAINKGFEKAKGEILAYLNADDIYLPGAFSEVGRIYKLSSGAYWFAGRGKVINGEGKEIASWSTRYKNLLLAINRYSLLLTVNYLMQPSVFVTQKAWKRFGPFSGHKNFVMEYDLWLKIANNKMPVVTEKYLSAFRIEPGTITKRSADILLRADMEVVKKYTANPFILFLHQLNNFGRLAVGRVV